MTARASFAVCLAVVVATVMPASRAHAEQPAPPTPPTTTPPTSTAAPTTTQTTPATTTPPTAPTATTTATRAPSSWGLALLGGGASLAVGSAVTFSLVDAWSRPDDPDAAPDETAQAFVEAGGLLSLGLAAVSGALVLGGAVLVLDELTSPAPATAP